MRHELKQCTICTEYYSYQSSGHGCHAHSNSDIYCPSCSEIVHKAIVQIPKRYSKRLRKVIIDPRTWADIKQREHAYHEQSMLKVYRLINPSPDARTLYVTKNRTNIRVNTIFTYGADDHYILWDYDIPLKQWAPYNLFPWDLEELKLTNEMHC